MKKVQRDFLHANWVLNCKIGGDKKCWRARGKIELIIHIISARFCCVFYFTFFTHSHTFHITSNQLASGRWKWENWSTKKCFFWNLLWVARNCRNFLITPEREREREMKKVSQFHRLMFPAIWKLATKTKEEYLFGNGKATFSYLPEVHVFFAALFPFLNYACCTIALTFLYFFPKVLPPPTFLLCF